MSGETVTLSGAAVVHTLPSVSVLVLVQYYWTSFQRENITIHNQLWSTLVHFVHEQQLPIIKNILFPFIFIVVVVEHPPTIHYRVNTVLGGGRLGNNLA